MQLSDPRLWRVALAALLLMAVVFVPVEVIMTSLTILFTLALVITSWDMWGDDVVPWARSLLMDGDIADPTIRNAGDNHATSTSAATSSEPGEEEQGERAA